MRQIFPLCILILILWTLVSCSSTKFVPDGNYLLDEVKIESDNKQVSAIDLRNYVRQNPNARWFSLIKVPLYVYSLSGRDSTQWLNRVLRKIGDPPVIYSEQSAMRSRNDLVNALNNRGYLRADVSLESKVRKKKLKLKYRLHTGPEYRLHSWKYDIPDTSICKLMENYRPTSLSEGMRFDANELNHERQLMANYLQNNGYYEFNKEYITCTADTVLNSFQIDLTIHVGPYGGQEGKEHPCYRINRVNILSEFDLNSLVQWRDKTLVGSDSITYKGLHIYYQDRLFLHPSVFDNNIFLAQGDLYNETRVQRTQAALGSLQAVRYADIRFVKNEQDSTTLNCLISLLRNKTNSFSAEIEGTNSAGDLGAAASVSYQNRNLFRGSELFTFKVRGAYEAVTGLQGYTNQNYIEWGVEASINFPRFLFPFIDTDVRKRIHATSEIGLQYNSQMRPEFYRHAVSATWSYKWVNRQRWQHTVDLIDLNYIYMPWISTTFREEYLDNPENQNSILLYNYDNLFIMKLGYGFTYRSDGARVQSATGNAYFIRFNIETSGNLLYGLSHLFGANRNEDGQYDVMNVAYAQYVKGDVDFAKSFRIDWRNSIVFHVGVGIAYPYGNSQILPFEKRYFAGGANSVRGWSVRRLGPGSFSGSDRNIDFINQTGDIKLDINLEYRTKLFWKLHGAVFVDAGNIWTIREYDEQPGGVFRFDSFYKQIAISYGLGLRFDFDYFVLRFDGGMKALNPAYESGKYRYPLLHPDFSRDFAFHFAVGYPF